MKILLLYNGYPRLSQSYQYDEAIELSKRHQIMVFSWKWPLYSCEQSNLLRTVPPYIYGSPETPANMNLIRGFQPDHIHTHFLHNAEVAARLAGILGIGFTLRTHSFDILSSKLDQYTRYIRLDCCKGVYVFHPFRQRCINVGYPDDKLRLCWPMIDIAPFREVSSMPHGDDIMSGGAFLPKKNIRAFIQLAVQIKRLYPSRRIRYYSVEEDPAYAAGIYHFNITNGSPVEFLTVQHCNMPAEYLKHQWLIYSCCPKLATVGLPLMVAEAQASGVGVIMYRLRDDLADYVTSNGYLYRETGEVLGIIEKDFDPAKRLAASELSARYDISGLELSYR